MDQKDHIIDQKGLKMYENRQKIEFSDLKNLLFSGIFGVDEFLVVSMMLLNDGSGKMIY